MLEKRDHFLEYIGAGGGGMSGHVADMYARNLIFFDVLLCIFKFSALF